jgi:hypothetical protein
VVAFEPETNNVYTFFSLIDSPNTTDANAQPTTTPVDDDQDTSNNNDDDDEEHTTHPNETNDGAIPTATDDSGTRRQWQGWRRQFLE